MLRAERLRGLLAEPEPDRRDGELELVLREAPVNPERPEPPVAVNGPAIVRTDGIAQLLSPALRDKAIAARRARERRVAAWRARNLARDERRARRKRDRQARKRGA